MHPFSLVNEATQEVTGGKSSSLVISPLRPVFPPKHTTMVVGEEGGFPPMGL